MQLSFSVSPKSMAIKLTCGVLILTVPSIIVQILKYSYNQRSDWMDMFNLDRELNFPTWYSALMLVSCGLLLATIAKGKEIEGDRYYPQWRFLSIIFYFLALDELVSIHEILIIPELAEILHLPGFLGQIWVIPGAIFVLWLFKKYWVFINYLPPRSRWHFLLAGTLYVGGALVMEAIGGQLFAALRNRTNLIYALVANVEEVMEMMGLVVFIYGLLFYLSKWQQELEIKIKFLTNNQR
jgi:hypothetical protein